MKQWGSIAATAAVCIAAGWLVGRFQTGATGSTEFAISPTPEPPATLVRRAHLLWQATPDRHDGRDVLRFLSHLAERLDDASWWAVSGPVLHAWNQAHQSGALEGPLEDANKILLPRFLRSSGVEEVSSLLARVNSSSSDAGQIQEHLEKAVAGTLPPAGFAGSAPERIIAAVVRNGDLGRAGTYLSKLSWPNGTADADRTKDLQSVRDVVEVGLAAAEGKIDLPRLIRAWLRHSSAPLGRSCFQPSLENAVLATVGPSDPKLVRPRIEELFQASASEPGAEAFWARILFRLRPHLLRSGEVAILDAAGLARSYAARYQKPGFEFEFWMAVGDLSWRWSPDDPRRAARLYRRALGCAGSDKDRGAAVKQFAFQCQRAGDAESALLAVRETFEAVKDPGVRTELSQLTDEVMNSALKSSKEAAARRQADRERKLKVIAQMRELLLKAQKENRPEEELRSIQSVITEVEAQLQE